MLFASFRHIESMNRFIYQFRLARELKRLARTNARSGEPLSVMDDLVFKAMFTADTGDSREALRLLLSACTHREITGVQIKNTELNPAHLEAKAPRLDVLVTFNDGEVADLEMQMSKTADNIKARAVYYTSMLHSAQSRKGRPYDEIKRVYQIFFLNEIMSPRRQKLPRRYYYMEEEDHDRLSEVTEIIFYELPKLERQVRDFLSGKVEIQNLPEDVKWCIYIKYRHDERAKPLIRKLCREEKGIMRAEKSLAKLNRDFEKALRDMQRTKSLMDQATERKRYLEELKAETRAEEKNAIARKLKAVGVAPELIAQSTGLTADEIDKL
jgi:predicted transposase/invertase (TIGR01784 family)